MSLIGYIIFNTKENYMKGSTKMNNKRDNLQNLKVAHIDGKKCIGCGSCKRNCEYGAIFRGKEYYIINIELCVGCKVCATKCPADAITYIDK